MGKIPLITVSAIVLFSLSTVPSFAETLDDASTENSALRPAADGRGYAGTQSCRKCHEKFYRLWASSHHGLAMQPYTREFARKQLLPQKKEIVIGKYRYRADISGEKGWVIENGPVGEKKYLMEHAMGGKNVYYFLTPMARGRLQTLPVAYDVRRKEWLDTAASGVRHFPGVSDEAVDWKDPLYTFNTSCYSCHVSQLSTNFDPKTDTYHSVWREPGINCETCHGPGNKHVRVCEAAPKGTIPTDLKIIRGGRDFTAQQNNSACAPCHAKMSPLTETFKPGERYFDHYDLVALESPDFHPDGRDLGENYTYTLWRMSPCAKSGQLSCLHCHTSSGRYRFKGEKTNQACMPCHKEKVDNPTKHSHHKPDSTGNKCVACHMPMTEFARMKRSDHSMLPPTPAVTIAFKSPNACTICHQDKTPQWADTWVRKWRKRDFQAGVLHRAGLIDAARKREWSKLPETLAYLERKDRDEIFAVSLLRLLVACPDDSKWPPIRKALTDPSPLVRSAAAASLEGNLVPETVKALLRATEDEYRLVRVRSAMALASYPRQWLKASDRKRLRGADAELRASLLIRPDQWSSYYNLGNYFVSRRELKQAVKSFQRAHKMEPRIITPLVNMSIAYARLGDNVKARESLVKASRLQPDSPEVNFNLGLLEAENGNADVAEKHLLKALKADPRMAEAAYNLGVLLARRNVDEAIRWCGKAYELRPDRAKYGFTLAFYLRRKGDKDKATEVLRKMVADRRANAGSYMLLGEIYEKGGERAKAAEIYRQAVKDDRLPKRARYLFDTKLRALSPAEPNK